MYYTLGMAPNDRSPLAALAPFLPSRVPVPEAGTRSVPWQGGAFRCTEGACFPLDARGTAAVQSLNRQLGIRGRAPREGFDSLHLRMLNRLIVNGELRFRPLFGVEDVAKYAYDLLRALLARPGMMALGAATTSSAPAGVVAPTAKGRAQIRAAMAQMEKVKRLQRALQAAMAKADNGSTPKVSGKLDGPTVEAVNNLLLARGGLAATLSVNDILVKLEELPEVISRGAVASAQKTSKSTVGKKDKPTVTSRMRPPKDSITVGQDAEYTCSKGICVGNTPTARDDAHNLQVVLNSFPPSITALYYQGRPVAADGKVGAHTVEAIRSVIEAAGRRQGKVVSPADLAGVTPEGVVATIGEHIAQLKAELELQLNAPAASVSIPQRKLNYNVMKNGNVAGDKQFRCYVMALQAQLNRLAQRLVMDGVIGANTAASVNVVLSKGDPSYRLVTPEGVAMLLPGLVLDVMRGADGAGAAPVSKTVMKQAAEKCLLESRQPIVDARYFGGQPVSRPTQPPPPAPTNRIPPPPPPTVPKTPPGSEIPVVKIAQQLAPESKVRVLQQLLNRAPAPLIAQYYPSGMVSETGHIDDATVGAVRGLYRFDALRQNKVPERIDEITPATLARDLDIGLEDIPKIIARALEFYAAGGPSAPTPTPAPPSRVGQAHGKRVKRHTGAPTPAPPPIYIPVPAPPSGGGGEENRSDSVYPPSDEGAEATPGGNLIATGPAPTDSVVLDPPKTPLWPLILAGAGALAGAVGIGLALHSGSGSGSHSAGPSPTTQATAAANRVLQGYYHPRRRYYR